MLSNGRLTVSDTVSEGALLDEIRGDSNAWACCISGALEAKECLDKIKKAGFKNLQMVSGKEFHIEGEGSQALTKLLSITVKAYK